MAEGNPLKNKTKWELLVPFLGISMLFILINFTGAKLSPMLIAGIGLLLAVYVGLVLSVSLEFPRKAPRAFSWRSVGRAALNMAAVLLAAVGVMMLVDLEAHRATDLGDCGLGGRIWLLPHFTSQQHGRREPGNPDCVRPNILCDGDLHGTGFL
jgi:hypothetical protein